MVRHSPLANWSNGDGKGNYNCKMAAGMNREKLHDSKFIFTLTLLKSLMNFNEKLVANITRKS